MYVLKKELLPIALGIDQDMIVVHAFDAYGEKHGRSEEGFRWALEMEGIIDNTAVMNLRGVADLQGEGNSWSGNPSFPATLILFHSKHRSRQRPVKFLLVIPRHARSHPHHPPPLPGMVRQRHRRRRFGC